MSLASEVHLSSIQIYCIAVQYPSLAMKKLCSMLLLACVIVFTPWTVAEKPTRLLRRQLEDNGRPMFDEFVIVKNLIQEYEEDRFLEETLSMSFNHCPASSDDESKAPGNPCSRLELARERSIDIIRQTFDSIEPVAHITNGDEVKYGADS